MKETEFDRYERMKKLEKEAEVEKRKLTEANEKKKGGRPKLGAGQKKHWSQVYSLAMGDDDYEDINKI